MDLVSGNYTGQIVAFVRYKTVKGRRYYQLVRNYRENGKHRQQVLCHLGQHESLEAAIDHERSTVLDLLEAATSQEEEAASTKAYLLEFYGARFADGLPSRREAYSRWETFLEERDASLSEVRDGVRYIKSTFLRGSFLDPEYDKEVRRWNELRSTEQALLVSIFEYHDAKDDAEWNRLLADEHQAKLHRYLAVKNAHG